jgi:hypothetical protein
VQQVAVEDEGCSGGKLDRYGVLLAVVESVGLPGAIEPGIILFSVRVEHAEPL